MINLRLHLWHLLILLLFSFCRNSTNDLCFQTRPRETVDFDIRFLASSPVSGELILLIVNIEQGDFYPDYPLIKQALYYDCQMISAQYGTEFTESRYEKLRKVYNICICMHPPKGRENSINRYSITEKNNIGNVRENPLHYDLLSVIMIYLSDNPDNQTTGVLQLLNVLLSSKISPYNKGTILQNSFNIPITKEFEKEVLHMGSFADILEAKAMAKGMVTGGKIIKLYTQGTRSEDIAASLHLDLESVQAVIAECVNK